MSGGNAKGDGFGSPSRLRSAAVSGAPAASTGRTDNAGAHPGSHITSKGISVDEALKKIAMEKARREKNEQFIQEHLGSLQKFQDDVVSRWSAVNDFEKVDLVCAELLKNNNFSGALQYIDRVRGLLDTIMAKLLPRAIQEGYEPPEHAPASNVNGTPVMRKGTAQGGNTREFPSPVAVMPSTGLGSVARRDDEELKATKARLEQAQNNAKQLELQLSDLRNKNAILEEKYKNEKIQLDRREASLAMVASRQATKGAELQGMIETVERSKRSEAEILEANERLRSELLLAQDKIKWLEKTGSATRVKLQSAEEALKKERKEDAMLGIKIDMAAEDLSAAERDLKAEKRNNLKALKAKNKEIDSLKTRVQDLETQLRELQDSMKQLQSEHTVKSVGEEYKKKLIYNGEGHRSKTSARTRQPAPQAQVPAPSVTVDEQSRETPES